LHESKRQDYFQYVCDLIVKSQKKFRSLKLELIKSMDGPDNEYFGLSLENLIENN
jgi:hypothetical protein